MASNPAVACRANGCGGDAGSLCGRRSVFLPRLSTPRRADGAGALWRDRRFVQRAAVQERAVTCGRGPGDFPVVARSADRAQRYVIDDRHGLRRPVQADSLPSMVLTGFYHRLPATVVSFWCQILWAASTIWHRLEDCPLDANWSADCLIPAELAVAGIVVALFCVLRGAPNRSAPGGRSQQAAKPWPGSRYLIWRFIVMPPDLRRVLF